VSYFECDACGATEYTAENPFVEVRVTRPSDRTDLCCIMGGCSTCFPGSKTPAEWADYIESPEAYAAGYLFLT
jgi:hypothetical protein